MELKFMTVNHIYEMAYADVNLITLQRPVKVNKTYIKKD